MSVLIYLLSECESSYGSYEMDNRITLTADSNDELNKQIDGKLKQGYLLSGGMQEGAQGERSQVMILPNNIDNELTLAGAVKLVIGITIYGCILYIFI